MVINEIDHMRDKLIVQLLSIPFPFRDVLREQIRASALTVTALDDYFCVTFSPIKSVIPFPAWLPSCPLAWQIPTDDAPVIGQMFQQSGVIEKYEIIDMGLTKIKWDYVWNAKPLSDIEYDSGIIIRTLAAKSASIQKIVFQENTIDIALSVGEYPQVASFRGCTNLETHPIDVPVMTRITINTHQSPPRFFVSLCDGLLSFRCDEVYLRHHCQM